jgi:hypothetical protein
VTYLHIYKSHHRFTLKVTRVVACLHLCHAAGASPSKVFFVFPYLTTVLLSRSSYVPCPARAASFPRAPRPLECRFSRYGLRTTSTEPCLTTCACVRAAPDLGAVGLLARGVEIRFKKKRLQALFLAQLILCYYLFLLTIR